MTKLKNTANKINRPPSVSKIEGANNSYKNNRSSEFKDTESKCFDKPQISKNSFAKAFALIIPSIIAVIILVTQVMLVVWKKYYIQSIVAAIPDKTSQETAEKLYAILNSNAYDSLEYIVAIIGIAVSIWIGLNIYNIVEKRDYENLIEQQAGLKRLTEEQKLLLESSVEIQQKITLQLQLSNMLKVFSVDSSTEHYIEHFSNISHPEWSVETVQTIIKVEGVLSQATALTEQNAWTTVIKVIATVEDELMESKGYFINNSQDSVVQGYYHYKLGELFYYKANALFQMSNISERAKRLFESAIEKYLEAYRLDNKLLSIENGIGISYLRLVTLEEDINKKEKYKLESIKYLKIACEKNPEHQQAIRSLGSAYESIYDYDKAISQYKREIELYPKSYFARTCLASAYLKKADVKLGLLDRTELYNNKIINLTSKDISLLDELLSLAEAELNTAKIINPAQIGTYYRLGEINTLRILIHRESNDGNSIDKYKRMAEEFFNICRSLQKNCRPANFHLRNYYEVVNEIKKAKEINDSLSGGNSEEIGKLYAEYLENGGEESDT